MKTNLKDETKMEMACQMVIMDAMEKGHTNKQELIEYMSSKTFKTAVLSYVKLINDQF